MVLRRQPSLWRRRRPRGHSPNGVSDQHAKRLTARGVFVAIAAFIEVACQARTTITKTKANRADLESLKQAPKVLADRDWGP